MNATQIENQDELTVDDIFIPAGRYKARLQYIIRCKSKDFIYYRFCFETNKIRISRGKPYMVNQILNTEDFKSIFYWSDYSKFIEPIGKLFDIEVIKKEKYSQISTANEIVDDMVEPFKIPFKEDYKYSEFENVKNGDTIYFRNNLKQSFTSFLNDLELEEKNNLI